MRDLLIELDVLLCQKLIFEAAILNSDDDLPLEKTITMHNVMILIKPFFNVNFDHYTIKCFQKNVHINNIKILYYSRIKVFEGIDVNQISPFKKYVICHY